MKSLSIFISLFLGFVIGAIVLYFSNIDALEAYKVMFLGSFSKPQYISYIILRSTPIILTGLSVLFAFKTGLFNIGTEGQFIIGAITAVLLGYKLSLPVFLHIPTVIIFSMIMAGLWGGIAGFIKAHYGVHEVISTIMLNWIALYLSNYLVMNEALHRPDTETTEFIQNSASISILENFKNSDAGMVFLEQHPFWRDFLRPPVNAGFLIAIIVTIVVAYILNKTTFGFKLKATGFNFFAAMHAGIDTKKKMFQSLFISGALSGLAGALHVMGVSKNVAVLAQFEGYGFDGIAVALIGSNSPFGAILSGLFLSALKYSGQKIQSVLEAPSEVIGIMIGSIILFIGIQKLLDETIRKLFSKRE